MRLLYFAWLRAKIGTAEEEVALPSEVHDVKSLLQWLKTRGPGYAEALKDLSTVRVAIRLQEQHIHMSIEDNGKGFSVKSERGMGLLGMEERASHLGGTLTVESHPGAGSTLRVALPVGPVAA